MPRFIKLSTTILLVSSLNANAQTIDALREKIDKIIASKDAIVGVSINGINGEDIFSINGETRFPMQSVSKFPIALAVLSEIDKGKFSLDQKIQIPKKDLYPNFYSPIKDKYPDGVTLKLSEILGYTVSKSDNVGCDALLKLLGGPQVVENYLTRNKFKNISIKINEQVMQSNWDLQFQNWTTPHAFNKLLISSYGNKNHLLSARSYNFIWKVMTETETGGQKLKGELPANTVVAHKTGWSGINKTTGITAASNDVGVVFLPNGKHFFISIFVTNSKESTAITDKIIADIAKVTWDYFVAKAD